MNPERVGRYRIDGVLGRGAMGVVYRGHDPGVGRTVAIKTVRRDGLDVVQLHNAGARFRREARAAGRLSHPNIVTVHDFGEDAGTVFLVCEYVPGAGLDQRLAAQGRPPLLTALAWLAQLLVALECAHAHGVVHRDVKASNLLLANGWQLKLADFGIAQVDGEEPDAEGLLLGTPSCMAPEQVRQEQVDARADVFAAGALLHQLLTGERAFRGSADEAMRQVLEDNPLPPSRVSADVPAAFDAVVACALSKRAQDRYPSANDFLVALREAAVAARVAGASAVFGDDPTLARPRRGPALAAAAGATVCADADTLARIEASLRQQVGPIAPTLLKKASRHCATATLDALLAQVARSIPDALARERFLASIRREPALDAAVMTSMPNAGAVASPLDEATLARVQSHLARLIGPMAALAVRRGRRDTASPRAFVEHIAAQIPDAATRQRFLGQYCVASLADRD